MYSGLSINYGRSATNQHRSMDWFKGKFTGKPHIYWENLWFPVDFPLNQSIEIEVSYRVFPQSNE